MFTVCEIKQMLTGNFPSIQWDFLVRQYFARIPAAWRDYPVKNFLICRLNGFTSLGEDMVIFHLEKPELFFDHQVIVYSDISGQYLIRTIEQRIMTLSMFQTVSQTFPRCHKVVGTKFIVKNPDWIKGDLNLFSVSITDRVDWNLTFSRQMSVHFPRYLSSRQLKYLSQHYTMTEIKDEDRTIKYWNADITNCFPDQVIDKVNSLVNSFADEKNANKIVNSDQNLISSLADELVKTGRIDPQQPENLLLLTLGIVYSEGQNILN